MIESLVLQALQYQKVPAMTILVNPGAAAAVTKRTKESREPAGGLGCESVSVL